MDTQYKVSGTVVAIEASRYDRVVEVRGDGIWAVVTIEDDAGRRWSCPWGIDPEMPQLGDRMMLGCRVTERVT